MLQSPPFTPFLKGVLTNPMSNDLTTKMPPFEKTLFWENKFDKALGLDNDTFCIPLTFLQVKYFRKIGRGQDQNKGCRVNNITF